MAPGLEFNCVIAAKHFKCNEDWISCYVNVKDIVVQVQQEHWCGENFISTKKESECVCYNKHTVTQR